MSATKTPVTLLASQSLGAGATVNVDEWDLSTAYGGLATVRITNGATPPTTAPVVTVYVGEASGVKRQFYAMSGNTTANSVSDFVVEMPPSTMFVNAMITNGATNAVTVDAAGQELTQV